jgi:hypothetical protein
LKHQRNGWRWTRDTTRVWYRRFSSGLRPVGSFAFSVAKPVLHLRYAPSDTELSDLESFSIDDQK